MMTDGPKREDSSASYHDLHITTAQIPRTSIFNLPFNLKVTCCRVAGWELWQCVGSKAKAPGILDNYTTCVIASEYSDGDSWLVLDVAGYVILDSRRSGR